MISKDLHIVTFGGFFKALWVGMIGELSLLSAGFLAPLGHDRPAIVTAIRFFRDYGHGRRAIVTVIGFFGTYQAR